MSLLLAAILAAAPIDGKWVSERKMERDGQSTTFSQTFDLKSEGSKLTGSITSVFGSREPLTIQIQDGKIDGNKFSFSATYNTPNGDFRLAYAGSVEGNTLKGNVSRGDAEPRPFEATRK
jgi:hypothetical protein